MKSLFSFFQKKRDLEFVDTSGMVYLHHPVQRAIDVETTTHKTQKKKYGKHLMPGCPGILDYAQLGYIIPAWVDIHIIANKAGVAWYVGSPSRGDRGFEPGRPMDEKFLDGAIETQDGVPPKAILFGAPWKVFGHKNITGLLMPAYYHSTFLDDLHIIPGTVDYTKFHTLNLVCIPKRECEVHIKAGDPLLQVIPMVNSEITAGYGPGTQEQLDYVKNEIAGDDKNYYRKYMAIKKKFNIEMNKENIE